MLQFFKIHIVFLKNCNVDSARHLKFDVQLAKWCGSENLTNHTRKSRSL